MIAPAAETWTDDIPDVPPVNESKLPAARRLSELRARQPGDDSELLKDGYLCRGAGLLLVGPTGIGKSSLALQAALSWAVGREAFGIVPARPLRSLLVQAENSDEDLAEMRDGVLRGLGFTPEAATATGAIVVVSEDSRTGLQFFELLRAALEAHHPDLVWIDPLLAYIGGDVSQQQICSAFLRNNLNPLLHEFGCAGIVIHHVNKPPSNAKSKPDWRAGDFAYLGSGSAELANWPRAVLAVRNIGSNEVFELVAGKRGGRLDWRNEAGERVYARFISHYREPGVICWEDRPDYQAPTAGRPKETAADELFELLPPDGLATGDWLAKGERELGISERNFHRLRAALVKASRVMKTKATGRYQPVNKAPQ
jgi:hypothetical protein